MLKKNIKYSIKKYIHTLRSNQIKVKKVILFGSYARGTNSENSDIDIAIITDKFANDRIEENQLLLKRTIGIDTRIEAMAFTPEEYKNDFNSPILYEIRKHGKVIKV